MSARRQWWRVDGDITLRVYTDVMAATAEEAHRIVFDEGRPVQRFPDGEPTDEWVFGDVDSEPTAREGGPPRELECEDP